MKRLRKVSCDEVKAADTMKSTRAGLVGWVGDARPTHARERRELLRSRRRRAHDVQNLNATNYQSVGNKRAMASPGYGLRAHQNAWPYSRELYRPIYASRKFWGFHVIGKPAKAGIVPAQILGARPCVTQASQLFHLDIGDAALSQGWSKRFSIELRIVPRAWNGADIDHAFHSIRAQQFDKLVERPRRVADRKNC